jgi:hypothetical protein
LCDTTGFLLEVPAGDMQLFDRNLGLTNPPGPPSEITGYSGTCNGSGGLLQLGGSQNTINNDGPTEYPIGEVVLGVANDGWVTLAEGSIMFDTGAQIVLTLDSAFANTLDIGGGPDMYPVSIVDVEIVGALTISGTGCASDAACPNADINCDDIADGFDIAVIRRTDNWLKSTDEAAECRADVNGDGVVDGFDISVVRRTDCWLQ